MSKEDKENVTKDYMDDLEEYRANKSLAVHNVAINSFHDVRRTLDLISVQVSHSKSLLYLPGTQCHTT